MALGEAKNKAKKEFAEALEKTGLTLDQCRAWVDAHPEIEAAALPGAAHARAWSDGGELRVTHIARRR